MTRKLITFAIITALFFALSVTVFAAVPVAASFSATVPTNRQSALTLQGSDADGTTLVYATTSTPAHGTLVGLNTSTGVVIYQPNTNYTGADSFTYTVTSGGQTSSAGTVTLTVSNAKTRIVDCITDAGGGPAQGLVSFVLTQTAAGPTGLIPVGTVASAQLNSLGCFDVSVYPSRLLAPAAYYQVYYSRGAGSRTLAGIYDIPLVQTPINLAPYRVTDVQLAARYTFTSQAAVDALAQSLSTAIYSTMTSAQIIAALGYTPLSGASLGTMATQSAAAVVITGGQLSNVTCNGCAVTGGTPGSTANPGSTTVAADTDADGAGIIDFQTRNLSRAKINNDGTFAITGGLEQSTRASLPATCAKGRRAIVTDDLRGEWRCTGVGWDSVTGAANVKDFGASGSAATTSGSATASSLTVTVSDGSTYQPGHGIFITGAGASGANYIGTVATVAGNTLTLSGTAPATTVSSVAVKHDDTAAWQAALNAAGAHDTGRVFAPEGVYRINGTLQGTSGFQGRLLFPNSTTVGRSIEITGAVIPNQTFGTVASAYAPSNAGTVIITELAGGAQFSTGTDAFVGTRPVFRNVTLRQVNNPTATLLDCRFCHGLVVEHSFFDTGTYTTGMSQPTTGGIFAIRTPVVGNAADTLISHTLIAGFFLGIEASEHLRLDYVTINGCVRPIYVPEAQNDPITAGYVLIYNSPYSIYSNGGAVLSFQTLNIEHVDPADGTQQVWQRPAAGGDVYDPSNVLRGTVVYNIIKENLGGTCAAADTEFAVNGATNLVMDNLCGPPLTLISTFFNSWVNVGGGEGLAGYFRKGGLISLRGNIKDGTVGNTAFQLPARYCPAIVRYFPVFASGNTTGYVSVGVASGATCPVTVRAGNNAFISLDGISFVAGQ